MTETGLPVRSQHMFPRFLRRSLILTSALPLCSAAEPPVSTTPLLPYRWASVAMGGAGFVSGITAHPGAKNLIYARTDVGGAYRFHPADGSWTPLLDWLPPDNASAMGVESLALDPRDPSKIYLLTGTPYWRGGTSILRSADQGKTWQRTDVSKFIRAHGNKAGRHTGERLAVDPNLGSILFCGSRNNGLWKSIDSGATWNPVAGLAPGEPIHRKGAKTPEHPATTRNGNGICFVVFDPASGAPGAATPRLYAGISRPRVESYTDPQDKERKTAEGNIFQSTDGGITWMPLPPLPEVGTKDVTSNGFFHPVRALLANGCLFVTFQSEQGWGGGVFRYHPDTRTWSDITPIDGTKKDPQGNPVRKYHGYGGIDLIAGPPARMMVSTFGLYHPQKDITGKTHWGERIYFSPRGFEEDGSTWLDLFGQDKARLDHNIPFARGATIHWGASVTLDPFNPQRAFVTSGNGIWATPSLLDTLSPAPEKRALWKMAVKGLEESVPMDIASIPGGPLVSAIWDYAGFTNKDPAAYSENGMFRVCGGLNVRLASVGAGMTAGVLRLNSGGELCWSQDSGTTWTALEKTGLGQAGTNANIALSADSSVILYSPQNKKVYRNQDSARKWPAKGWSEITDLAAAHLPVADPIDPTRFYSYQGSTGKLLRSVDSGKTFQPLATIGHGANWIIRAAPGRKEDIWLAMHGGGIARYHNGAVTRIPIHRCSTLGFGRGRTARDYPTLFIWGRPLKDDPEGVYRSTDQGKTWFRINDDLHRYGDLANGGFVKGCMNVFGRVYRSTAGRGIPYGTPQ